MDYEKLSASILGAIENRPGDIGAYEDLFSLCQAWAETDFTAAHLANKQLKDMCDRMMDKVPMSQVEGFYSLWRRGLLFEAPYDFDSYLTYMELDRQAKKRFYQPRKKQLKPVVDALQALCGDDKLDLLAVSLPPGVGKTTLAIFLLTWIAGRDPNNPNLTGSHSNSFVRGVYDECLRLFDSKGEYLWHDVFPAVQVSSTNAKDCRIDLDKRQRFETLEFTSIGTGNAGLYRAANLLYCDDLVSGIEVALSKERLDKLWETYTTDLRQRKIGDKCKELHIATRWSVHDVIGRLEREYENNPRAKFIRIPAMNEDDESNFDYEFGVGFSTKFYREQRDIMDSVSWKALYQNQPIEREGLVYHPDELRRFFELPAEKPDAIIGVCDTKDKGADYAFLPVGYVYGQDYYIWDCICDNGLPDTVDARLSEILVRDKVKMCRFESNSAGRRIAEKIQDEVKKLGGITNITTKFTTANKETKIIVNSAWVKEHCLFLDESKYKRNTDYGRMMDMLCSYTVAGKNKHDDVPDGMAMFAEFAQSLNGAVIEVFSRPF
jgi:predicted phage terminase large subunit-like protein